MLLGRHAIPPMVVFAGKYFNSSLSKGEVPATLYGMLKMVGWSKSFLQSGSSKIFLNMLFLVDL